ncbi:hypothetical protein RCL1_002557 [Eukaryota sp. TZLM3-RCL]
MKNQTFPLPCTFSMSMSTSPPEEELLPLENTFIPKHVDVDDSDAELEDSKDADKTDSKSQTGKKRSTRNISLLCLQLASELQRPDVSPQNKTRDALATATGFARQRLCTVVSVYKAIGLITENRSRKGVLEWNTAQAKVLPELLKHVHRYDELKKTLSHLHGREKELAVQLKNATFRRRVLAKSSQDIIVPRGKRVVTLLPDVPSEPVITKHNRLHPFEDSIIFTSGEIKFKRLGYSSSAVSVALASSMHHLPTLEKSPIYSNGNPDDTLNLLASQQKM